MAESKPRRRWGRLVALGITLAVLVPLGYLWATSLVPGSYNPAEMGYADYGGGPSMDQSMDHEHHAGMSGMSGTSVADIHAHSHHMKERFLVGLERLALPDLPTSALVPPQGAPRGNFLAFDLDQAESVHTRITARNVTIDRRDRRVRFGFGIYHDEAQVDRLLALVAEALQRP